MSESRWQRAEGRPPGSVAPLSVITRGPHARRRRARKLLPLPSAFCQLNLVGLGRLERPTSRLSGVRSNQLSYRPKAREQRPEIRGQTQAPRRPVCSLSSALCPLTWKGCVDGGRVSSPTTATRSPAARPRCLSSVLCSLSSDLRKEVIQPQVPLRLPCYDFTPVADLTVDGYLPPESGLAHRLRVKPTPMV
jgi:hypothetical protein